MPVIFITGNGDVPMSVQAMKAGAIEFLTKPFRDDVLLGAFAMPSSAVAVHWSRTQTMRALRETTLRSRRASVKSWCSWSLVS